MKIIIISCVKSVIKSLTNFIVINDYQNIINLLKKKFNKYLINNKYFCECLHLFNLFIWPWICIFYCEYLIMNEWTNYLFYCQILFRLFNSCIEI